MRDIFLATMLCAAITGCSQGMDDSPPIEKALGFQACPASTEKPLVVKVADAIADPKAFDGKFVSLEGYYCANFELSALYTVPGCKSSPEAGLWVGGLSMLYRPDGVKVVVTGIFDAKMHGHLNKWPAGLCTSKILESPRI